MRSFSEILEQTTHEWPNVPDETYWALVSLPFLTLVACCVWLRVVWPCPTRDNNLKDFTPATLLGDAGGGGSVTERSALQDASNGGYYSVENGRGNSPGNGAGKGLPSGNSYTSTGSTGTNKSVIEAGEVAGDYSLDWKGTFDMTLVQVTVAWLAVNIGLTLWIQPTLFQNAEFWVLQVPKLACMIAVSILAGSLCRYFCPADDTGYIMTSKNSWFKVNYTRKVQHFAAYLVPLLFRPSPDCHCTGTLELSWGVWVTLIGFLVMIKPIREAVPLFMLQFNGLDRPEDRPHTLEWIIKYNIWPGEIMIVFFAHLFRQSYQRDLVYILVFVTGVGDGLAEPVGIWLGKHKYMVRSCDADKYYERSFEGSCCVFIVTVATIIMVFTSFATFWQFLVALLTLPMALTLAEAFSPHTMDTPFIMGVGGAMLYAIIKLL
ncbi:conserved unknown protein [Ectocarpus siliculosus]|uniref:Dolichol kinase n=1 Tax=Ectocarpus siliculosus TaxID=2880 RepID=D8LR81_ECTSI|nr:conserved unknown protein [Ectocarpus siliculosus]|eukprot:CBN74986.1 conserved unknown protein [Ectocarpus siliculosus]